MCSHCCILGHTKGKYYRPNGFHLGHKGNIKLKAYANQSTLVQQEVHYSSSITQEQYNHLPALLDASRDTTTALVVNHM